MTAPQDKPVEISTDASSAVSSVRVPLLVWLAALCFLVSASSVVLVIWVPKLQHQRAVAEVERLGGSIYRGGPRDWNPLAELTGEGNSPVVSIDLSSAHLTDESAAVIRAFSSLQMVSLGGPELTDASLDHLAELPALRRVILVNCPHITEAGIDKLIRERPGLEISRRGPALLGVVGERFWLGSTFRGCEILEVRPGTAAEMAGLRVGDVVTRIEGQPIVGFTSLAEEVSRYQPGTTVSVTIYRNMRYGNSRKLVLPVTLGRWQ